MRGGTGAVAIAGEPVVAIPAAPYRGIRPFRYADHAIFFARERETRLLTSLVDVYRGVFLYGDSGNGKSSLVNAGLLPQARLLGFEPIRVRVQPRAGEELVIEQIVISDDGTEVLPCVLAPGHDGGSRIVLSIAEFEQHVRDASHDHQPLLVFDQFEEILTLFDEEDAGAMRLELAEMIVGLLRERVAVKLLFAFREDYLGRIKQLLAARPELVDQALRLGPPSVDALQTIIRGPFDSFPGRFERELDEAVATRLCAALAERFGTGEVSLSEVQTVCLRLWESPDPGALLAGKGVQGLLEDELGQALDSFPGDLRAAAIAVLSELVTSAGTRNVISAEDLRQRVAEQDDQIPPPLIDAALDRLERESQLVRRERRRDLYLYEITSEFLVPWISRRREELRLVRERRRERRRLLRILGSIAAGLLILAAIVAAFLVSTIRQRAAAQRRAAEVTSLALAASSTQPLPSRPDVALSLAFEAYRQRPSAEAHAAVVRALLAARPLWLQGVLASGAFNDVAFSPDGKKLAAGDRSGTVLVWNTVTWKPLARLTARTWRLVTVAFSPDGELLAVGDEGGPVQLWNTVTWKPRGRLTGSYGPGAFSPDGRTLATGTQGSGVRLWNVTSRKQLGRITRHIGEITTVAFSPDGRTLATGSQGGSVRLWNAVSRQPLGRITRYVGQISSVAFSPDGRMLATSGRIDTTVRLWNAVTRKSLGSVDSIGASINDVAFSPDGKTLATGDAQTVLLWHAATRTLRRRLRGDDNPINGVAFSHDGKTLAAASDGAIRLWSTVPPPRTTDRLSGHINTASAAVFSRDGATVVTADEDGRVGLWDTATGRRVGRLTGHTGEVTAVTLSRDGQTVASGDSSGKVYVWSAATHKLLTRITGVRHTALNQNTWSIHGLAFSPRGTTLATGDAEGSVRLWSTRTGKQLRRLADVHNAISGVAFSPDGTTLAAGALDGVVRLWSPGSGKDRGRLTGDAARSGEIPDVLSGNALTFSPDGRTIAFAGGQGTVSLWDATTRKRRGRLGHNATVMAVAFSPDGQTLGTGAADHTVRLWNTVEGKQLGSLTGHTQPVVAVAFGRDGRTLMSMSGQGLFRSEKRPLRIWKNVLWRSFEELRTTVCDIIVAGVTPADWARYAIGIPYRRSCP